MRISVPVVHIPALIHRIALARFSRNRRHIKSIAKQNLLPLAIFDTALNPMIGRSVPTSVILQPTVNIVGLLIVDIHMVKLSNRNVLRISPSLAAVIRNIQSPIVAIDHVFWILGMHVKRMMIGVDMSPISQNIPVFATIFAAGDLTPNTIYPVLVAGVHVQFGIVKRTVTGIAIGTYFVPAIAAIIGAIHRGFSRLHKRIHPIGR